MSEIASQRPSRIVVDLDAIGHNLRAIRTHVGVPVMGIVKANAYGHGLVQVARHLEAQGVDQLGVAFVEEALQHRGTIVGYHPEGTRSKSDDPYTLLPAQPGVGAIIHRARPIVVPVFVLGLINDLPRQVRSNFDGTGEPVNMVFGPPLDLSAFHAMPAEPSTYRAISEAVCAEIARLGARERQYRIRDGIKPFNPRA